MRITIKYFREDIQNKYDITSIEEHYYVHIEIRKGMYGLKEAGIIALKLLVKNLFPLGYHSVHLTPGLWKHDSHNINFTLDVENFGIK